MTRAQTSLEDLLIELAEATDARDAFFKAHGPHLNYGHHEVATGIAHRLRSAEVALLARGRELREGRRG